MLQRYNIARKVLQRAGQAIHLSLLRNKLLKTEKVVVVGIFLFYSLFVRPYNFQHLWLTMFISNQAIPVCLVHKGEVNFLP